MRSTVFVLLVLIGLLPATGVATAETSAFDVPAITATAIQAEQQPAPAQAAPEQPAPAQQAAPTTKDYNVDINVNREDGGRWYASPVWLAIGGLAVLVILVLIVAAMRGGGGGTTIVRE